MKFAVLIPVIIHVYIFWLETFGWGKAGSVRIFGVKKEDVEAIRPWAFNQGWYNLFLALAGGAGVFIPGAWGSALVTYALGSMVAAALVLVLSAPEKIRSALVQGLPALLGLGAFWGPSLI